ncbi:MFS transporter [Clostridium paraputrificum]|uniref:MFS transporter n=1 Tax=Clostridium paraputrificum TaxID=29363 RepID=UPI003D32570D
MEKNKNVHLMYLIVFLQGFVFYGSIATIYRETRGISISEVFIIESIFFVLMIMLEVPWGWFADRFGYKNTLVISNFIFFISKIIFWRAAGFQLFLLERFLLAIALSGLSGCDSALLYLSIDKEDNSEEVFGKYNFYSNSGFLLSSLVSGFIINISMDLAAFFTIIPYLAALLVSLFLVDVKSEKENRGSIKESFKEVLKNKKFIILIITFALMEEIVQGITVFLNQEQYIKSGIDIKYFGVILAFLAIVKLTSAKSYKISEKFGQKKAILLLSLIISITSGALAFISSPGLSILFIAIISGASALMMPMISDIKNKSIDQEDRATILSIYSMIGSLISVFINPVIGATSEVSLEMGIVSCFIIGLIGSLSMWKILKSNRN